VLYSPQSKHLPNLVQVILVSTGWPNVQDDEAVIKMTENVARMLQAAAETIDQYYPYRYINYASAAHVPTVFEGYGEKNLRKLIEIQKAVDPMGCSL
jgi:hypothetical protein